MPAGVQSVSKTTTTCCFFTPDSLDSSDLYAFFALIYYDVLYIPIRSYFEDISYSMIAF